MSFEKSYKKKEKESKKPVKQEAKPKVAKEEIPKHGCWRG